MSDIFLIAPSHNNSKNTNNNQCNQSANYIKLQEDFIMNSLGFYTIQFSQMIARDAHQRSCFLQVLSINKVLRQITKKFMLSDLQLVYVGHISNILEWGIDDPFIKQNCSKFSFHIEALPKQTGFLIFFLNLIAYFVKKYIGQTQEYKAISEFINQQSAGHWQMVYQKWLKTCPNDIFRLSPRQINKSYSYYSRNCQNIGDNKNYNNMVDQIMQLSTTYAMIPGEIKQRKKRKHQTIQQVEKSNGEKSNYEAIFGRKISKINELQNSNISNFLTDNKPSMNRNHKITLAGKGAKQTGVNNIVTDFYNHIKPSQLVVSRRYTPQSTIGFIDPNPGLFDSKFCSSGSEIIPYPLRSNSNIFKSKLFE